MKRTTTLTTLCILCAAALPRLAAPSPVEVYDRDTPFNGAIKTSAPTGALDPADTYPGLNLIPWPKTIEVKPGQMKLTAASRIVAGDASLKGLANILSDEISLLTGLKLPVAESRGHAGDIVLKLNKAIKADEPILTARPPALVRTTDGAYTVTIGEQAVVEGFDYRATTEGTATLLQSITQAGG